jgi:hypothetical protein
MFSFDPGFGIGQVVWMLLFIMFIFFYPKYMLYKLISEIEMVARKLESYTKEAVKIVVKTSKEKGNPSIDPKDAVEDAIEFFLIPPVDLDPFGILKKIEHVIDKSEDRFEEIAGKIAPESDEIWKANVISLLKGSIGLNNIAKIVRHYVEFVKKTNNLQIAMLIHMNLPMIKKIAKAQRRGVEAISKGKPLGDSIGPLVTANLIKGEVQEVAKDVISHETTISDRNVYILKARGPGATLGKLGDAVKKICEEKAITRIITIDASVKLEGEETGKVCEGIGAAIGDPGPEKAKMEEMALKLNIPLDAIIVKMSIEEAISPMIKKIGKATQKALDTINNALERSEKGSNVLIVGVGNTCGIGNSFESVKDIEFAKEEKEKEKEGIIDKIIKWFIKKQEEKREEMERLEKERKERAKKKRKPKKKVKIKK